MGDFKLRCLPFKDISPYVPRWRIVGRIVDISDTLTTKTGQKFFHTDLLDSDGCMIRAKYWGDAAEKWGPILKKGQVYSFSKGKVSVTNKRFNSLPHNYEITFYAESEIVETAENSSDIQEEKIICFTSLRDIHSINRELPFPVNVLILIRDVQPLNNITTKGGDELSCRKIHAVDATTYEIEITFWGKMAEDLTEKELSVGNVLSLQQIQIRAHYQGGKAASSTRGTQIRSCNDFKVESQEYIKAQELKDWYNNGGSTLFFTLLHSGAENSSNSERRSNFEELCISEIKQRGEGLYIFVGKVRRIYWRARSSLQGRPSGGMERVGEGGGESEERLMYPACPSCKKKMYEMDNEYGCDRCNTRTKIPDWRYMVVASFFDLSASISVRLFAEQGNCVIGASPEELMSCSHEEKRFLLDKYVPFDSDFRVFVKAKSDQYNGEYRTSYTALKVEEVSPHALANTYLQLIKSLVPNCCLLVESKKNKTK